MGGVRQGGERREHDRQQESRAHSMEHEQERVEQQSRAAKEAERIKHESTRSGKKHGRYGRTGGIDNGARGGA